MHNAQSTNIIDWHTILSIIYYMLTTTVLRPFFPDHPGELVPEENFWTFWCKGRLMEAKILTIRLSATPSELTSAYLHHLHILFTGRMPFLSPNQQHQSTEGDYMLSSSKATNSPEQKWRNREHLQTVSVVTQFIYHHHRHHVYLFKQGLSS